MRGEPDTGRAPFVLDELEFATSSSLPCAGPTRQSHYIVRPFLFGGGMPDVEEAEKGMLDDVDVVVNLRAEISADEYMKSPGKWFCCALMERNPNVTVVRFPVDDFEDYPSDDLLFDVCFFVYKQVLTRKKVFVHCKGGHGRTTLVVGTVLSMLMFTHGSPLSSSGLTLDLVLRRLQFLHTARPYCRYLCQLPETQAQHNQLGRMFKRIVSTLTPLHSSALNSKTSIDTVEAFVSSCTLEAQSIWRGLGGSSSGEDEFVAKHSNLLIEAEIARRRSPQLPSDGPLSTNTNNDAPYVQDDLDCLTGSSYAVAYRQRNLVLSKASKDKQGSWILGEGRHSLEEAEAKLGRNGSPPPRVVLDGVVSETECLRFIDAINLAGSAAFVRGGQLTLAVNEDLSSRVGDDIFAELQACLKMIRTTIEAEYQCSIVCSGSQLSRLGWSNNSTGSFCNLDPNTCYWDAHVDKANVDSYDIGSLVYFSDYVELGDKIDPGTRHPFTGGRFVFHDESANCYVLPRAGRLIFFSGGFENVHRVERVEEGQRYALACWWKVVDGPGASVIPMPRASGNSTIKSMGLESTILNSVLCTLSLNSSERTEYLEAHEKGQKLVDVGAGIFEFGTYRLAVPGEVKSKECTSLEGPAARLHHLIKTRNKIQSQVVHTTGGEMKEVMDDIFGDDSDSDGTP